MYTSLNWGAIGVKEPFAETAALAARHGFEGINLSAADLKEKGAAFVGETLAKANLRPGAIGLPVAFRDAEDAYERSLVELETVAQAAAQVGCDRCSTYILSFSDELPFDQNFQFHVERLRRPAQILGAHGMSLALEFLGPKTLRAGHTYEFIHTPAGMLDLCEAVGNNVGLLLDAWHWYTAGGTAEDLADLKEGQVVDVHVNDAPTGIPIDRQIDNVRCLPGETGVIDLQTFFRSLRNLKYDGPVAVEPFKKELREMSSEDAVRTTAEALKSVWS